MSGAGSRVPPAQLSADSGQGVTATDSYGMGRGWERDPEGAKSERAQVTGTRGRSEAQGEAGLVPRPSMHSWGLGAPWHWGEWGRWAGYLQGHKAMPRAGTQVCSTGASLNAGRGLRGCAWRVQGLQGISAQRENMGTMH